MKRSLLYFTIITFIIIVISVGTNLYHNFTTSTITADIAIQTTPIPSGFDLKAAESLQKRQIIAAGDLSEKFLQKLATQSGSINLTPIPSPTVSASSSASQKKSAKLPQITSSTQPKIQPKQ